MRASFLAEAERGRVRSGDWASDPGDDFGAFCLLRGTTRLKAIVGSDMGWDHVSVSHAKRCPTWDEMCWVKNIFFKPDEWVMQLHPPPSKNINIHNYCLHLWRPHDCAIPTPPPECV